MPVSGLDDFMRDLQGSKRQLERQATAHAYFTAKRMQNSALENMSGMRIGLVTGRSRALYGAALRGTTAMAGYISWPSDIEFYPHFLNNGTRFMVAKPYHDLAFEQQRQFFDDGMLRVLQQVLKGASR